MAEMTDERRKFIDALNDRWGGADEFEEFAAENGVSAEEVKLWYEFYAEQMLAQNQITEEQLRQNLE